MEQEDVDLALMLGCSVVKRSFLFLEREGKQTVMEMVAVVEESS